jgi:hypothetical protein
MARLEAATNGYLVQVGWPKTRATRTSTDAQGRPLPWFTYPAIEFLADRVRRDWRILEYGSGAGTCWWSRHCDDVVAVEHDPHWAESVATRCPARLVKVLELGEEHYVRPAEISGMAGFDVVVVDGIFREQCLASCTELLSARGVVVLDDAQRPEYASAIAELLTKGFRSLPFHGPQPVSKHPGCTLVLYRDGNALGI